MQSRYQPVTGSTRTETFGAGTSTGTTLTASGTANTKGTYVSLGTTTFEWNHVNLGFEGSSAAADHLVDIAIDDGGGNKWIIAADLRHPSRISANASPVTFSLPLYVPKGSALYARNASSTASATMTTTIAGFSRRTRRRPRLLALSGAVHPGDLARGRDRPRRHGQHHGGLGPDHDRSHRAHRRVVRRDRL
jgi:hypothetical protein